MQGVTQAVYDDYRREKKLPTKDVIDISTDEIRDIYRTKYWNPMNLEGLGNELLILNVYDQGVNSGIRTAIKLLQRLVGVEDDGFIGKDTIEAVQNFNGDIAEEYIKRRKLFYVTLAQRNEKLRVFLKGWLRRTDLCKF